MDRDGQDFSRGASASLGKFRPRLNIVALQVVCIFRLALFLRELTLIVAHSD